MSEMSIHPRHMTDVVASDDHAMRRADLFRETPLETLERWALGTAWALKPSRIGGLPGLTRVWLTDLVAPRRGLPDPERTLEQPRGLCGMVHDLSVPTLTEAYRHGLFTFAHFGPLKWFSLPERCVLFFDELHVGKTIRKVLRQGRYRVTFDRDFESVIKACAGRRDGKWHVTWITPRIMRAYADLFDAGHVHSFEVWNEAGALVGGGYGVSLGRIFFTESQFSHRVRHFEDRVHDAQLAPGAVGLRAERRQVGNADHPQHELPRHSAGRIPHTSCGQRADRRKTRPLAGGGRPEDGGRMAVERRI